MQTVFEHSIKAEFTIMDLVNFLLQLDNIGNIVVILLIVVSLVFVYFLGKRSSNNGNVRGKLALVTQKVQAYLRVRQKQKEMSCFSVFIS